MRADVSHIASLPSSLHVPKYESPSISYATCEEVEALRVEAGRVDPLIMSRGSSVNCVVHGKVDERGERVVNLVCESGHFPYCFTPLLSQRTQI